MRVKLLIIPLVILVISSLVYKLLTNQREKFSSWPISKIKVHFYEEPTIDLSKIKLYVVYALPNNKKAYLKNDWLSLIRKALDKVSLFHHLQFKGFSSIKYEIYHSPIILPDESEAYNTKVDTFNLKKFLKLAEDVEKTLSLDFDVFNLDKNNYNILVIFYEGEGAFGAVITDKPKIIEKYSLSSQILPTKIEKFNGVVFISIEYLTTLSGESLLYHEIAHTLGIPDTYQNGRSLSSGIMGAGRFEPLENNYLDKTILNKMISY